MPRNVEIKARLRDPDAVRARAAGLADGEPEIIHQLDTFFHCGDGRLKLRRFADGRGELIHYQRQDTLEPTESRFSKSRTADPSGLHELLTAALGVLGEVRKRRTLCRVGSTRIHLDEVEGLGSFLELEVVMEDQQSTEDGARIARDLMAQLGIEEDDLVAEAYIDLLTAQ